ncbi:MAG: universal stress protein [Acidobacteria bacterium]|nr:universal stress protein [Acidobacteriota bacterium]
MAHVSHKLPNSFQGALAGGGDPATSPLYVFGPFLKLIVVAGVAHVTFGASVWMVVLTVAVVSAMYRRVMYWVVDGSGGSGLSEEEFGSWAVKINAGITFIEYTLTFLVSMAALVTFIGDRFPVLDQSILGIPLRALVAVVLSILTGWAVNLGPKFSARIFGPATLAVLLLLWAMVIATVWKLGFRLPALHLEAFLPPYLHFTFAGYTRILALMTGIEIFANLVAAYSGTAVQKSRKAFGSLLIIMGTTVATILIVGPAILDLSDPTNHSVSVFTQTMDRLLPHPLPYLGTLIGIIVLGSAAAASAQGLQNLALGLRYRHYIPAMLGERNKYEVAAMPVWIEVALVSLCFLVLGTREETYLAIYAAGVFILLSMTGWAAAKRLARELRTDSLIRHLPSLIGTILAAALTTGATLIIFVERFKEGAWTYLIFIPILYLVFSHFRRKQGEPRPLEEHLGRFFVGQYLLPFERKQRPENEVQFHKILVPLDGTLFAEHAIAPAEVIVRVYKSHMAILNVQQIGEEQKLRTYLDHVLWQLKQSQIQASLAVRSGSVPEEISRLSNEIGADLIVMSTHGMPGFDRFYAGDVANRLIRILRTPVLLLRPTERWQSRNTKFQKILIALDGSEAAEEVLRYARALARSFNSEMVLLSVPESELELARIRQYLESVAQALVERGYTARALVTGSGAVRTILDVSESEGVDLIMLSTHGRGRLERKASIGSVTDRIIDAAPCPVFLAPI